MVTSGAMLKGASVYLYSLAVSTFSSFIIWKKSLCHLKVSNSYDLVLQMRFAVNNFNNFDEDRLVIKYLWIMNANRITSAVTCLTLREWMQSLSSSVLQRLQVEMLYRSIPNMTYLQSSEQPVTLTTQFYHSSPLLPSLKAGIKCGLNVCCCRVLHLYSG